jgi:hypothetical protein
MDNTAEATLAADKVKHIFHKSQGHWDSREIFSDHLISHSKCK